MFYEFLLLRFIMINSFHSSLSEQKSLLLVQMWVQVSNLCSINFTEYMFLYLMIFFFFFLLQLSLVPFFTLIWEPLWTETIWNFIDFRWFQRVCYIKAWENVWCKDCSHKSFVALLGLAHLLHKVFIYHKCVVSFLKYSVGWLSWTRLR